MSSKRITERDFFTCEAVELAEKLIGKIICNRVAGKILRFICIFMYNKSNFMRIAVYPEGITCRSSQTSFKKN